MDTNLFPIGMEKHIVFVIIATIFFILQFIRTKRWYQLVMAAAFCISLLIYIDQKNKTFFYGIGITEAVLLFTALVLNIVQAVRISREEKAKKAAEEAEKKAAGETEKKLPDEDAGENEANAAEDAAAEETEA